MDSNDKLILLHDKLMRELRILQQGLEDVEKQEGPKGAEGIQGPKGDQGDRGRDGVDGKDGRDGADGKDGVDGETGVGISDVTVDFDNHLRVKLTDGSIVDAGEIDTTGVGGEGGVTAIYAGAGRTVVTEHPTWIDGGILTLHPYTWDLDGGDAPTGGAKVLGGHDGVLSVES